MLHAQTPQPLSPSSPRTAAVRTAPGRRAGAALLGVALAASAALAGDEVLPVGATFKANLNLTYGQREAQVDSNPDGDVWTAVWHSPLGADIYARTFDGNGVPLTGEFKVDQVFTNQGQSEPEVCIDEFGNTMYAWSDFHGNDGSLMGIFGRVYGPDGQPKGGDFQVNVASAESQWEPKGDALPGGGFVMAWSGTSDGDAYFRLFGPDGTPLSGDLQANTFMSSSQIDTAVAAGRGGTLLIAFEDFSGHSGVPGEDIWVRAFTLAGVPVMPLETLANANTVVGRQKEPRVAADGQGNFIVAWEHRTGDGSGSAIYARRYSSQGVALGPEFRVNQVTAGDQLRPDVAADFVGNFVVSFEDHSTGRGIATVRRFDAGGAPLTGDISVDSSVAGEQHFASVTMDWAGEDLVVTFAAPGGPFIPNGDDDIYVRRMQTVPLSLGGVATPGSSFQLQLDLPGGGGLAYLLLPSLGTAPGVPLPDGRTLHLAADALFGFGLISPNAGGLLNFVGALDAGGAATGAVALPGNAGLVGLTLQFAVVSLDLSQPSLVQQLRHVTDPLAVTIQ